MFTAVVDVGHVVGPSHLTIRMCIDMRIDMRMDMCRDMRIDMCMDMFIDIGGGGTSLGSWDADGAAFRVGVAAISLCVCRQTY